MVFLIGQVPTVLYGLSAAGNISLLRFFCRVMRWSRATGLSAVYSVTVSARSMPLLWLKVVARSFDKHFGRLLLPGKTKLFTNARNETGPGSVYSEEARSRAAWSLAPLSPRRPFSSGHTAIPNDLNGGSRSSGFL